MKIETGILNTPLKVVIDGPEGLGKTTLASKFPNPLFLDTEGSTVRLNVRRIKITSWEDLLEAIKYVKTNPTLCKTLVIDTADWAEILAIRYVCNKNRKTSLEDFGYGKGYTFVADEFVDLLKRLNELRDLGIHIVLVAHAKPRKYELPEEQGQFDRWEMKLSKQTAPLIKEWCDMLLFCNYKTYVITSSDNSTKKATGGKRVMYTTHNPCWDAKNRFGLKEELDLDFKEISHLFKEESAPVVEAPKEEAVETPVSNEPVPEAPKERATVTRIKQMITEANITDLDLRKVVASRGHYKEEATIEEYSDDFITRWIIPNWKKIIEMITKNKEAK